MSTNNLDEINSNLNSSQKINVTNVQDNDNDNDNDKAKANEHQSNNQSPVLSDLQSQYINDYNVSNSKSDVENSNDDSQSQISHHDSVVNANLNNGQINEDILKQMKNDKNQKSDNVDVININSDINRGVDIVIEVDAEQKKQADNNKNKPVLNPDYYDEQGNLKTDLIDNQVNKIREEIENSSPLLFVFHHF